MGYWSNCSVTDGTHWILAHNHVNAAKPTAGDLTANVMLRSPASMAIVATSLEVAELASGMANRAPQTPGPAHFVKGQGIAGCIAAGCKTFANQGAAEAYATLLG